VYGYAPGGDPNLMYAAVKENQVCMIYDQCAANGIDCGGGKCTNKTSSTDPDASCYCNDPLRLIKLADNKFDCACQSDKYYYKDGVCQLRPDGNGGGK